MAIDGRFIDKVLIKLGLMKVINRTHRSMINGEQVILPTINGTRAEVSEPWMARVIASCFAIKQGSFVDVGVNIGQTLIQVVTLDKSRKYVGFEPNANCVAYVERLIERNGFTQCEIVPVAVGEKTEIAQLYLYFGTENDPSASMIEDFRPEQAISHKKNIAVLALEDLPPAMLADPIALLKIDVEGAELDVIRATRSIIEKNRPFISIEILPVHSEENRDRLIRQTEIENITREIDYQIFRVMYRDGVADISLEPIETIGVHADMNLCEYILCPAELADALREQVNTGHS